MTRLFVTADIHGSLNTWMTIEALMKPSDVLVIAGDLFDTRYGNYSHTDFQPDFIKQAIQKSARNLYYVYGNCDVSSFSPDMGPRLGSPHLKKYFLTPRPWYPLHSTKYRYHHFRPHPLLRARKKGAHVFMNPGSLTNPRNNVYSYGIIDKFKAEIWDLKTGNTLGAIAI